MKVDKTNLWQIQQVVLDPTVFYSVAAVVIIAVAVVVILVARRMKK
jgi:hypothetical protein